MLTVSHMCSNSRLLAGHVRRSVCILAFVLPLAGGSMAATGTTPAGAAIATEADLAKVRSTVHSVAIVSGSQETEREIAGSYRKDTPGAAGGMVQGTRLGSPSVELGGINLSVSIPQLILPGAIAGSIGGSAKRKVQDFRDALARDLASAEGEPLTSARLALHVYQELRDVQDPGARLYADGVSIPGDIDAVLYVNLRDISIDVRGDDAILKTTAEASLASKTDGTTLYRSWYYYQDADSLSNWTRNDNALWHDYANFAQHYLGREISADIFSRVDLRQDLHPADTKSAPAQRGDAWSVSSKSLSPTLAWQLGPPPQDAGTQGIDPSQVRFDLEIYDMHRPVYAAQNIAGTTHTVAAQLDSCQSYRWSVRPSYPVDGGLKYGEWMRAPAPDDKAESRANIGEQASDVPAYLRYFATLKIDCRAR